jgi:hypothetical protein
MTTLATHNQSQLRLALGAALLLAAANAMAASYGDAHEQAGALLAGVHRADVHALPAPVQSFPDAEPTPDAQVQAQRLLAGKPKVATPQPRARESLSAASSPASGGVDAWEMARRMLTGKGT